MTACGVRSTIGTRGRAALFALLGLALFATILALPPLLPAGAFPHLPAAALLAALAFAAWAAARARIRRLPLTAVTGGSLLLVIALFLGVALALLWGHVLMSGWVIWGVFPINDAADWLTNAGMLLWHGWFETPRGRPLGNAMLAGLFSLSGFDLRVTAAIMAGLVGAGIFTAAAMVWRSHGAAAAVLLAALGFTFFHEHLGTTSSEAAGVVLGLAAFALIWEGARRRHEWLFLGGLAVLTIAMLVRVGPLFVLPALLIWAGFAFRGARRFDWRRPILGVVIVLALFAGNRLIAEKVTPSSGGGFVNAVDSWYALFVEGKLALGIVPRDSVVSATPWRQIYRDNPDLETLPRDRMAARKAEILLAEILRYPHAALVGAVLEWNDYLFNMSMVDFVPDHPLRFIILILALIGFVDGLRRMRRDRLAGLLVAVNVGIFLSIPFLVGGGTRVGAATFAFVAMLAVEGVGAVAARFGRPTRVAPGDSSAPSALVPVAVALVLVPLGFAALAIGPLAGSLRAAAARAPVCAVGETGFVLRYAGGSALTILADGTAAPLQGHAIPRAELLATTHAPAAQPSRPLWRYSAKFMLAARLPLTMLVALDRLSGRVVTLFITGRPAPADGSLLAVCTRPQGGGYAVTRMTRLSE